MLTTLGKQGVAKTDMRQDVKRGSHFFLVTSVILLALTLVGFGDNLITDVGQPSNSDPKFIVHGLFCGLWMLLLVAQAMLIGKGNVRLHRKFGVAGLVVAAGVTLSTVWIFIAVWKGWADMNPEVRANRILLPSFSLFVTLAWLNRRRSDWHKRLIYCATLFMLGPVLSRSFDPLLVPLLIGWSEMQIEAMFLPWFFGVWGAFFVGLAAYDWSHAKRFHPVTGGAVVWFGTIWGISILS